METRKLGSQGLTVSAMGLGCMGMSEFYGPSEDAESVATIRRALDLGITFLDTADMYGMGHNEGLVGRAVAGTRDRFVIATKFGLLRGEDKSFRGVSGKPEYVRAACEGSLRRLGMDYIDIYYQHRVDPEVPIEDTVGAMSRLVEEGKVRFLGLSEAGPETIRRANVVHPISALQTEYSLWSRDPEERILPTCRELGIGFVPYSPLGRAFLAGKFTSQEDFGKEGDVRLARFPRFREKENFQRNLELLRGLWDLASEKGFSPAQVALAWVMAQGKDIAPIPGTRRRTHLEENVKAPGVSLSQGDLAALNEAFPPGAAAGTRYDERGMGMVEEGQPSLE